SPSYSHRPIETWAAAESGPVRIFQRPQPFERPAIAPTATRSVCHVHKIANDGLSSLQRVLKITSESSRTSATIFFLSFHEQVDHALVARRLRIRRLSNRSR